MKCLKKKKNPFEKIETVKTQQKGKRNTADSFKIKSDFFTSLGQNSFNDHLISKWIRLDLPFTETFILTSELRSNGSPSI